LVRRYKTRCRADDKPLLFCAIEVTFGADRATVFASGDARRKLVSHLIQDVVRCRDWSCTDRNSRIQEHGTREPVQHRVLAVAKGQSRQDKSQNLGVARGSQTPRCRRRGVGKGVSRCRHGRVANMRRHVTRRRQSLLHPRY